MPESDKTRREELFEQMLNHLPDPISLSSCLDSILCHFNEFPEAMLGEVGLDRSARVPIVPGAEERRLSPFLIPFDHQVTILTAQLDLAVRQKRNISLHRSEKSCADPIARAEIYFESVQAQKASVDLLQQMQRRHGEDWWKVSVDFHSCGLSPETWKSIEVCCPLSFIQAKERKDNFIPLRFRKSIAMHFSPFQRRSTVGPQIIVG